MTANLTLLPTNCPVLRDAFETISAIAVEAVWLPNQAKAITLAQAQTALRDLHHRLPRLQDLRVFEAAVTAYVATLRSSLQDGDTPLCDTTRARLAQATELLELVRNQSRTAVDPADPWRGLYHPSRLPARNADGELEVSTTGHQGSHIFSSFSQGNCFIVLERDRGHVEAGEWVEVERFNHLFGG